MGTTIRGLQGGVLVPLGYQSCIITLTIARYITFSKFDQMVLYILAYIIIIEQTTKTIYIYTTYYYTNK